MADASSGPASSSPAPDPLEPSAPPSLPIGPTPLPLHRLASSALVAGVVAGPTGGAAFCAAYSGVYPSSVDVQYVVISVLVVGACCAFLVGCVGALVRLPALARVALLALAGTTLFVLGAAISGWIDGLGRGGLEAALQGMASEVARVFSDSYTWALLLGPTAPFLLLGGLRAGLAPRLGWPPRARWQALAGALGGVGFTLILSAAEGGVSQLGKMLAVFVPSGLVVGAALGLSDMLEPRLAAALHRRVVGDS